MRLRVTRSELARLSAGERVEETICFSAAPDAALRYMLAVDPASEDVHVNYSAGAIATVISSSRMSMWEKESQVGIYATLDLGSAGSLEIAIEKDFACLDGSDEENHDTFANPLQGKAC